MAGLTITEKAFWKERIAARIGKRIAAIHAQHPALFQRLKREAHDQALQSLGLAGFYAELAAVRAEEWTLERRKKAAQRAMLAALRGMPIDEVRDNYPVHYGSELPLPQEAADAIRTRQDAHQKRLEADDPIGREIGRWELERENLLDTIWLATSPAQIKQLWTIVGNLLSDEPTELEREALAFEPIDES